MLHRLGHTLLIFALVTALGGHWALLQTIAWTTMLADNLETSGFSQAVKRTFDGGHPCCMCNAIAAAKKSERKAETPVPLKPLEFPAPAERLALEAPGRFVLPPSIANSFHVVAHKPPTPPPRFASV